MAKEPIQVRTKVAHELIVKALSKYFDNAEPVGGPKSKGAIGSGAVHKKLTIDDVNNGITAFVLFTKMTGGSISGGINLYDLLQVYLLRPESRDEINKLVQQYRHSQSKAEAPLAKSRSK